MCLLLDGGDPNSEPLEGVPKSRAHSKAFSDVDLRVRREDLIERCREPASPSQDRRRRQLVPRVADLASQSSQRSECLPALGFEPSLEDRRRIGRRRTRERCR